MDMRESSLLSSKAVKMGSLLDRAMRDGDARARYALILERECLRESALLDAIHSSQPHLYERKR